MKDPAVIAAFASMIVAAVTGLAALAAQKAAARASTLNTQTTSRVDMEREAYERARNFDVATIARQDAEFAALHAEHEQLKERFKNLEHENRDLKRRIYRLEGETGLTGKNEQKEQMPDEPGRAPVRAEARSPGAGASDVPAPE